MLPSGIIGRIQWDDACHLLHKEWFFSLPSVLLQGNHFRRLEVCKWRNCWQSSFGRKMLSSHISEVCNPYSFSTVQDGAALGVHGESHVPGSILSSIFQGGAGIGHCPELWILCLVAFCLEVGGLGSDPVLPWVSLTWRGSWLAHLGYKRWQPPVQRSNQEDKGRMVKGRKLQPLDLDQLGVISGSAT